MGSRGNSDSTDIKMFLADKQIKQPSLTLSGKAGKSSVQKEWKNRMREDIEEMRRKPYTH